MHLDERSLLVRLFGEPGRIESGRCEGPVQAHSPNKSIPSGNTCDGIEHDFSALATEEGTNESWLPVVPKTEDRIAEDGN